MSTPMWRQLYNRWEAAVSPGLEELFAADTFRDTMALGLKMNADITRELERASRQWLHQMNLPAATDIQKLRQQVSNLDREVVALRLQLEHHGLTPVSAPVVGLTPSAGEEDAPSSDGVENKAA